jgi:quinoprotein glucose dehydrogenase
MYTPPSLEGTVTMPGTIGGSGWGGAAVDPTTGWAYVKATNSPALSKVVKVATPNDTVDAPYIIDLANASLGVAMRDGPEGTARARGRLPIGKPPYGTLTAIDLNTGEHKWQVPIGDSPQIRSHPALRGARLPDRLGVAGSAGSVVTAGGLVFTTGGGRVLYAVDARTGGVLWEHDLGQNGVANPMTYRTRSGTQFLVIASGMGGTARLHAFALASASDSTDADTARSR